MSKFYGKWEGVGAWGSGGRDENGAKRFKRRGRGERREGMHSLLWMRFLAIVLILAQQVEQVLAFGVVKIRENPLALLIDDDGGDGRLRLRLAV